MAIQHIIFDLDGTLMDTEKGNLYAWQKTLRYYVPWRTFSNTELKAILGEMCIRDRVSVSCEELSKSCCNPFHQIPTMVK